MTSFTIPLPGNDWDRILAEEFKEPYFLKLCKFLEEQYRTKTIYPPVEDIFAALKATSFEQVKVVILGQDPYIKAGEAHGLSFSVQVGTRIPPSLKNIFKELEDDLHCSIPDNGSLISWAEQGVLLLNTLLTVEQGRGLSHAKHGWEKLTNRVLEKINEKEAPVVFLLWGKNAQNAASGLNNPRHLILTAAHPSPLARGAFFGCKHFSQTNEFLQQNGLPPINWQIPNRKNTSL